MNLLEIIPIAVGLAMDAFAVSVACSITLGSVTPRQVFRIAFHFGLFQGMMPVVGWLAGLSARQYIAAYDHWIAFGLLTFIGVKAIHEAHREEPTASTKDDPTRGLSLVMFSVATSIDALAVGVSLAAINVDIWHPAIITGCVTLAVSTVGMLLGRRVGAHLGHRVEILGGLILIGIGVKILVSDTLLN